MSRQLELELRSDPSESKRLRKELHAWLLDEGINGATGQDIILAASEAFANSVQHPTGRTSERISLGVRSNPIDWSSSRSQTMANGSRTPIPVEPTSATS
jgi:anti-sigma regulatory factor (Ser/Thr protein kinase)